MKRFSKYISISALLFLASCNKSEPPMASGTFETTETTVSCEVTGKLLYFDIEEGDFVQKDMTVAKIDSTQLELQKKSLLAQISALKSASPEVSLQISALEERIEKQRSERKRIERLVAANSTGQKALDDIISEIKYLECTIEAKKSTLNKTVSEISERIKSISAQIGIVEDNISKCSIRNPVEGTVLAKYAEPNEIASCAKPLYKIGNLNKMYLRAYFSAADITKLKLGQKLVVVTDFGKEGSRRYEGTLVWISDESEFTPKGIRTRSERTDLVYAAKIAVENDGYLKIGQYAEVLPTNAE